MFYTYILFYALRTVLLSRLFLKSQDQDQDFRSEVSGQDPRLQLQGLRSRPRLFKPRSQVKTKTFAPRLGSRPRLLN